MAGFDTGDTPQVSEIPVVNEEKQQAALASYFQKVEESKAKEEIAQKLLNEINTQIEVRQKELEKAYARRVDEVGTQLNVIQNSLSEAKQNLILIQAQIDERQRFLSSFRQDYEAKDRALLERNDLLISFAKELDARAEALADKTAVFEERISVFNQKEILTLANDNNRKQLFDEQQEQISKAYNELDIETAKIAKLNASQNTREEALKQREVELSQKLEEAAPVLAQKDQVKEALLVISDRTFELKKWQDKLDSDAAQIRATQIAIDEKQAELASRERIVSAAEKALANPKE